MELRDQRNLLLDELSEYMDIDVTYSMEDVGANTQVEKLTITLASGVGHKDHVLVDGLYATTVSAGDAANGYQISISDLLDDKGNEDPKIQGNGTDLAEGDLYGSLQSIREILTGEGQYASQADIDNNKDAAITRGIPYYQKALDSLAYEFATEMNKLNNVLGADGKLVAGAGNLFSTGSNTDDATGITASNISVSYSWANQKVSIQTSADPNAPSGDTSRLSEFLALFDKKLDFEPSHVQGDAEGDAFNGTFEEMLLKIQSTLGEDQMSTDAILNNYTVTIGDLYVDREGVTGVDLNDEASNLMIYQKAYTAACRLMTVLNEALDSLINGTL